jgi:hypothetical protein
MVVPVPHLIFLVLLLVLALVVADYLWRASVARRARRRRLEARIDELKRGVRQRRERQTMNTRSDLP